MTFACNKLRSKVNNLKINIFVPKITLEYEHLRLIWKLFTTTLKQVMSGFGWFHLNFPASGNIFNIKWFYINWKMVSIFYIKEPFVINLRNETQYFYPGEKNRNIKLIISQGWSWVDANLGSSGLRYMEHVEAKKYYLWWISITFSASLFTMSRKSWYYKFKTEQWGSVEFHRWLKCLL